MFLGLNFSILGVLGVGKFGKNFFVCFFFGYLKQSEVCGSAHVHEGQLCSSPNKVQPKLFSGCVNIQCIKFHGRCGSRITTDRFPKQGPRCKLLGVFYEAEKFGPSPGTRSGNLNSLRSSFLGF